MEVKRYVDFDGEGGGTAEARFGERGQYVGAADFDRIIAERDALQSRLNLAEGYVDRLRADARRLDWIEENYEGHGGGTEFHMRLHIPCDFETGQLRHAIDVALEKKS